MYTWTYDQASDLHLLVLSTICLYKIFRIKTLELIPRFTRNMHIWSHLHAHILQVEPIRIQFLTFSNLHN
jgi:hypothetical protein